MKEFLAKASKLWIDDIIKCVFRTSLFGFNLIVCQLND